MGKSAYRMGQGLWVKDYGSRIKCGKKIIFLGKKDDYFTQEAMNYCKMHFSNVHFFLSAWGDPFPQELYCNSCDYIINFLSRWIIPQNVLELAKKAAINFHPASPDYPGIGCNNFALYNNATSYGVTCHYMLASVDAGQIIATKSFPLYPTDNVESLLQRTYDALLFLFYEIIDFIIQDRPLPVSQEKWRRKPFTRKDFNTLTTISPDISPEELELKIRATSYKNWGPVLKLHNYTFRLINNE